MADVVKWTDELCNSLGRACGIFYNPIVRDTEQGHAVFFQMQEVLSAKIAPLVRRYIRGYCRQNGYSVKGLALKRGHLTFEVKPETPKPDRADRKSPARSA